MNGIQASLTPALRPSGDPGLRHRSSIAWGKQARRRPTGWIPSPRLRGFEAEQAEIPAGSEGKGGRAQRPNCLRNSVFLPAILVVAHWIAIGTAAELPRPAGENQNTPSSPAPASSQLPLPTALPEVTPVPEAVRTQLRLGPFYQKHLSLDGFPILGSAKVTDAALREAAWIVGRMVAEHPAILASLRSRGVRLVVMAHDEYTTDLPEQAGMQPKDFWDRRARGLGGPLVSCAEENLLGYPGDPYSTENILIHEFAHTILDFGLADLAPGFEQRLKEAYGKAMAAGLWKKTYAAENPHEYWAEGVQDWFDNNRQNDAQHNAVNTRAELLQYDPALAALCREVFGDRPWRYRKPPDRPADERAHLAGYDPARAPTFHWRKAGRKQQKDVPEGAEPNP